MSVTGCNASALPDQDQDQDQTKTRPEIHKRRAQDLIENVSRETEEQIRLGVLSIKGRYPKAPREDWIAAEKHIRNLIRDGSSWLDLEGGVERYAQYCKATNRIVQNPGNWFGAADRPWLQEWALPLNKAEAQRDRNIENSQEWLHAS